MQMIIPKPLKKGDRVAIVSPAGFIDKLYLDNAVLRLESWGLKPYIAPHAGGRYAIFSGSRDERLDDLQTALDDKDCKAIFCSRGGYGSIQLINDLRSDLFKAYPKWICGFSDITVLHNWAHYHGVASLHCDMPKTFPINASDASLDSMRDFLFDARTSIRWKGDWHGAVKAIEGEIIGGNLSVFMGMRGTYLEPVYAQKILFIEDLNEELYHLDRMMHTLKLSGVFNCISGLCVGGLTSMKDSDPSFGKTVKEIILEASAQANIPVLFNAPFGHQKPNMALPLGKRMAITQDEDLTTLRSL